MAQPGSFTRLRALSDAELMDKFDASCNTTSLPNNPEYYLQEIARRDAQKAGKRIEKMTRRLELLTLVITVLTVVLVGIALAPDAS